MKSVNKWFYYTLLLSIISTMFIHFYSDIEIKNTNKQKYYSSVRHSKESGSIPTPDIISQTSAEIIKGSRLQIIFKSDPTTCDINKAPLKYNKDFAFSFTLDDGKSDVYNFAYPFIQGGKNIQLDTVYPGLRFSDGCGNKISFKLGVALTSVNARGEDTHLGNKENITWDQVKFLYDQDWDIFNHSYSHASGPGTDYAYEIIQNNENVLSKTGISLTHFVIPAGDTGYTTPAINLGMKAVYNQRYFKGVNGILVDTLQNLKDYKMFREFLEDENFETSGEKINMIANMSSPQNHYWYSAFTHHVEDIKYGGSLIYSTFKDYMNNIEKLYGIKGKDNILMAPLQEVYEYLQMRNTVNLTCNKRQDTVDVYLDFKDVPEQRRYDLTLTINSDSRIEKILSDDNSLVSFNNTSPLQLVNLKWNNKPSNIYKCGEPVTSILPWVKDINSDLHTYPNPASDNILITLPESEFMNSEIFLYDINGNQSQLKDYSFIDKNTMEIMFSNTNLVDAIYTMKIVSKKSDKFKSAKVVIKRK